MLKHINKHRIKEPGSRAVSRRMSILEGCTGRIIFNLTTNAFLVGFLTFIGIDDALCAKICALPVLAAAIQFISPIYMDPLPWKKNIILGSFTLHRLLLCFMFLIPIIPMNYTTKVIVVILIYFVSHLLLSFVMPAFQTMIIRFASKAIRGRFFGIRESYLLSAGAIVSLSMGRVMDFLIDSNRQLTGYIIIMVICFIATAINTLSIVKMYEVRTRPSEQRLTLKDAFLIPLKDKKFQKIIWVFIFWNVSLQFGGAFFGVYQVSALKLSYTYIMINTVLFTIANFISARIWGRVADTASWTHVSTITIGLLGITHFLWLFAAGGNLFMYCLITSLSILGGIAWGGIGMALFNLPFDYIDSKSQLVYIGFNSALGGLVGYVSAFIGAEIVEQLSWVQFSIGNFPIGIIQIILSSSGILIFGTALFMKFALPKPNTNM